MSFEFIEVAPALPTLRRWIALNRKYGGNTTLRMLEYEVLASEKLEGKVLDVGGGDNALYKSHLSGDIDYVSVNIDPNIAPTHLIEPGDPLPLKDNSMDCCVSMNTLEHVYDPKFLIAEMHRVLKPGGKMVITIPWMFGIHGHPDDFSRRTPSWWRIALEELGFSSAKLTPLIWGRNSVGVSITGFRGIFIWPRNQLAHLRDVLYAKLAFPKSGGTYSGARGKRICNVASGQFIVAVK